MGVLLKGLKAERIRRGMSLRDLAEASGVTLTYISELETGRRTAGQDVVRRLGAAIAATPPLPGADLLMGRTFEQRDVTVGQTVTSKEGSSSALATGR